MSGDVASEAPRPRPLSGGLRTLFSWLRRDEHSSSESLSSVGSDRTVASFAFLAPAHYGTTAPVQLPPPPPPTDSYRRRVRDRNLRRLHDRDITLHRKYGLYGLGYDALSLPSGRRAAPPARSQRERRATSECPRAHVPGKRRAPPPPAPPSTLTRPKGRKRPAPQPPLDCTKETIADDAPDDNRTGPMNRRPPSDDPPPRSHDGAMDCKPEKHCKKDARGKETKDVKLRPERSFLKQIFESRKRNSAIETASVRLLPNISELDKQAVEMIEKYRLKEMAEDKDKDSGKNDSPGSSKRQSEAWICTRCLRKYNSSVITCDHCLPLNKGNDSYRNSKVFNNFTQTNCNLNNAASESLSKKAEDKEKLKEMLKEMKDSLPKRPKNNLGATSGKEKNVTETKEDSPKIVEAPTLRIGSPICIDKNPIAQTSSASQFDMEASSSQLPSQANKKVLTTINSVIITQPVVLVHTKSNVVVLKDIDPKIQDPDKKLPVNDSIKPLKDSPNENKMESERIKLANDSKTLNNISQTKYDINTPLKISSLLNPIYIPKSTSSTNTQTPNFVKQVDSKDIKTPKTSKPIASENLVNAAQIKDTNPNVPPIRKDNQPEPRKVEIKELVLNAKNVQDKADEKKTMVTDVKTHKLDTELPPSAVKPSTSNEGRLDQHARRRDLINQLERSIAKGDEHAAAEAAVKLAQLRLSCSVLSFSSQIVAEPSQAATQQQMVLKPASESKTEKIKEEFQKSSTNIDPIKETPLKQCNEKVLFLNVDKKKVIEVKPLNTTENTGLNSTANADQFNVAPKLESANKIIFTSEKKGSTSEKPAPCKASTSKVVAAKKEDDTNEDVPILVWVEDKEATRGPVQLHVRRNAVIGDLRELAERSLGLAARMQRWIVGKTLCSDDNTPLATLAGPELTAHFYLCLVDSDTKNIPKPKIDKINEDPGNVYNELVKLEKQALVSNTEVFECGVCIEECGVGRGVVLRECVHSFCKECLSDVVRHSEEPIVSCPATGCRAFMQEREIRALVSHDDYEKLLARGLAAAESGTRNAFHCRTRDCTGWALCDPGVQRFPCPVCKRTNCVPCQSIHEGETCEQHRAKLQESAASPEASQTDDGTRALLNTLISRGEALECPECSAIITKKWGCDWVKCSACKTEICWVTKGKRWGPAGRGDTSAGCRCGVDGKRCHPSCGYCH